MLGHLKEVNLNAEASTAKDGFSGKQVMLFLLAAIFLTAGVTYFLVRTYLFASEFQPTELSQKEQKKLDAKLRAIGVDPESLLPNADREGTSSERLANRIERDSDGNLLPERYSEEGASRSVELSERELNSMLASNSDLAKRFSVDLSDNLASAKLLVPFEQDFPVVGGKTLRFNAGLELDYRNERPIVILRGISVMGVPIPNAWLGNLKNVDLVNEFGGNPGFWQNFANGVELIEIADGKLHIELKE